MARGVSRQELDRMAQRVPGQKGPRLDSVEGVSYWEVDPFANDVPSRPGPTPSGTAVPTGSAASPGVGGLFPAMPPSTQSKRGG